MKRVAKAIQAWRTSGEYLSREHVAGALGKSLSTVVRWEQDESSDPRLSEILAMEKLKEGLVRRLFPASRKRETAPSTDATE